MENKSAGQSAWSASKAAGGKPSILSMGSALPCHTPPRDFLSASRARTFHSLKQSDLCYLAALPITFRWQVGLPFRPPTSLSPIHTHIADELVPSTIQVNQVHDLLGHII